MVTQQNLQIVYQDVSILKPAEYNPRQANEKEYNDLKKSVEIFGLVDPIIVNSAPNRKNVVIGGHFRLKIAKDIGFQKVPVLYINIADLEKEKELNLRLNKNLGKWDFDLLANFDEELLIESGFSPVEIEDIFLNEKDFKRPEFAEGVDKPLIGNERYFYIEYDEGKDEGLFKKLSEALGENLKTKHEIKKEYFTELILGI